MFGRRKVNYSSGIQMPDAVMVQCSKKGWECGIWLQAGQRDTVHYFNPAIFAKNGDAMLMVRKCTWKHGRAFNSLVVGTIMGDMKLGPLTDVTFSDPSRNHEDPRVINGVDGLEIWCCSYDNPHRPEQVRITVDDDFKEVGSMRFPYGHNMDSPEKNWCPFNGGESMVYHVDPHIVYSTLNGDRDETSEVKWAYGPAKSGTPPVLINGKYVAFFHSSLPWKMVPGCGRSPRMRYYMGAYAFSPKRPYRVTRWTRHPLLSGSSKGPTVPCSPAVVFPCGAIAFGEDWLVSFGINDCAAGWARIPINQVNKLME